MGTMARGDVGADEATLGGGEGALDANVLGGEPVADGFVGEPTPEFGHGGAEEDGWGGGFPSHGKPVLD